MQSAYLIETDHIQFGLIVFVFVLVANTVLNHHSLTHSLQF